MNHIPGKQSLKALARQVLREGNPTPELSHGMSQLSHPRGTAKSAENQAIKPTVALSQPLSRGTVGQHGETGPAPPFINGDPDGDCIACGNSITDADRPDAIPVVGGGPSRVTGYLHGSAACYRAWFFEKFGKHPNS